MIQKLKGCFTGLLILCVLTNLPAAVRTSNGTGGGSFSSGASWVGGVAPVNGDDIVIQAGDIITIGADATLINMTINGTLRYGNNNTARTVNCSGIITINSGGIVDVSTSSSATHILNFSGTSLINNGTLDLATDVNSLCDVTFSRNGNQTVSGTGTTTDFNRITVNMGTSNSNILDFSCSNFTSALSGFLVSTNGTIKFSNSNSFTGTLFSSSGTIPATAGLWLNAAGTTLNIGRSLTVNGSLRVDKGTLATGISSTNGHLIIAGSLTMTNGIINAGNGSNERLISSNGIFNISGGTINIAARFDGNSTSSKTFFTMSGGIMICAMVSSTGANAPFNMSVSGSTFNMSGGTIVIQRSGGSNSGIVITGVTSPTVTEGTFQIGNASTPASNTMLINTSTPLYNLTVSSSNATAQLSTNSLSIKNNLSITAGTLVANNLNINVGGNWSNAGTFTPGSNTVTFDGASAQIISKTGGETFNNLVFSNGGTKTQASNITCNGIFTINNGATLDASTSNFNLVIKGNYSNSGTYTARNGSVSMNGSSAQTIGGSSVTNFYTLNITNAAGVKLSSAQNITNLLNVAQGTFNTQGNTFTLISTSRTQSARIGFLQQGTADVVGNVTVQRTIEAGPTGWHLLASPISGSSLSDWADDFTMSGFPGSAYPSFSFVSVYTYDETALGTYDVGYTVPGSISDPTDKGQAFWCYIGPTPVTIDVTGPINKYTVDAGVSFTDDPAQVTATHDGWNLVFNPYPCTIDWESATGFTKTKIDNSFQIWNEVSQQYEGWNATTHTGINGRTNSLIPSSQGFYVQTTGSGSSLIFKENAKAGSSDGTFLKTNNVVPVQYPQFALSINGNGYTDEAKLLFTDAATINFDRDYDMPKLFSPTAGVPNIATRTLSDAQDLGLNCLPPATALDIPLNAHVTTTGTYSIAAGQFADYPSGICLMLEDQFTHAFHDLRSGAYTCTLYDTTLSARFMLHIGKAIDVLSNSPSCVAAGNGSIVAQGLGSGPFTYVWKNESGNVLQTTMNVTGADTLGALNRGIYIVEINGNSGSCASLNDTIVLSDPDSINVLVSISPVSCKQMLDGSIILTAINGGSAPYTYLWNTGISNNSIYNLSVGNYSLTIRDVKGCQRTFVYPIDVAYPVDAAFTFTEDTLYLSDGGEMTLTNQSTNATQYVWNYGDGSANETEPDAVHTYLSTGIYTVSLTAINGSCSDTIMHTLHVIDTSYTTAVSPIVKETQPVQLMQTAQGAILKMNFAVPTLITLTLNNALGELLKQNQVSCTQQTLELSTGGLARGVYILTCTTKETCNSFRFIIPD